MWECRRQTTGCSSRRCVRYRTGMPWRDLPERFGDWKNVHQRFSRWAKSGVWEKVFLQLSADADNEYAMMGLSGILCGGSYGSPRRARGDVMTIRDAIIDELHIGRGSAGGVSRRTGCWRR